MFQDSLELHRQGRLEDAVHGYQAVLAAEPNHVEVLVHLGVLRLGQGLAAEAEALLESRGCRGSGLCRSACESGVSIAGRWPG